MRWLQEMRDGLSSESAENGNYANRLGRQNGGGGYGGAPQKNQIHLPTVQTRNRQSTMRNILFTKRDKMRLESSLKKPRIYNPLSDAPVDHAEISRGIGRVLERNTQNPDEIAVRKYRRFTCRNRKLLFKQ
jgi:hypothetical protein